MARGSKFRSKSSLYASNTHPSNAHSSNPYEIEPVQYKGPAVKIAIVISNYYEHISKMLLQGAVAALSDEAVKAKMGKKIDYSIIEVPGALEIPAAISALRSAEKSDGSPYFAGFIALGCVIRGETSHYDIVSNQSAQALMNMGYQDHTAIGNAILTVDNEAQAIKRADPEQGNKGAGAVEAALSLLAIQDMCGVSPDDYFQQQVAKENDISQIGALLEKLTMDSDDDEDDDEEDEDDFDSDFESDFDDDQASFLLNRPYKNKKSN